MDDAEGRGPVISDSEDALRAILRPHQWSTQDNRPSSAAFDDEVFSVDISSLSTPEKTAGRFNMVLHVVEFNCGIARGIGFDTREEPDENFPDNIAHAHVYFDDYHNVSNKSRKKRARKLSENCTTVF